MELTWREGGGFEQEIRFKMIVCQIERSERSGAAPYGVAFLFAEGIGEVKQLLLLYSFARNGA
ncbi:hypothetical protein DUZ99_04640 [Xylanibacillus composti]|uniref:Uncharacterized protein n=1 Tax=Xylanibacillus composti TaxID=1572762 RepID=A0A8J4H4B1_9BACL|nr:hypothetical protein [Xylanibacillus composti]GIQ69271.1 hypothetical protein XYCOK13_20950 [Xylanibacillus composti]